MKRKSFENRIAGLMSEGNIDTGNGFYMDMNSLGALSVKGCIEISTYTENSINLITGRFDVFIKGKELFLKNYSSENTEICGKIESISFADKETE